MTLANIRAASADQSVVYVYGVARAAPGQTRGPRRLAGIVRQAPVEPLVDGNLTAFVSAVPSAQFGASEFRAALNDADWLRDRILAHGKVLEELRASYDVVPFRFGTIYFDRAQAAKAMAQHRVELCRALDRIQGACEWGLKLYYDAGTLRRHVEAASTSIRSMRDVLAQASPGAGFFLQKRYAKALADEMAIVVAGCVQRMRDSLAHCFRDAADIQLQPAAVHGRAAEMAMNATYLVAKHAFAQFQQAVADWQKDHAAHGFDHELTGPWPPYHFVSIQQ
jgi:hypothetical protein